MFYFVSLLFRHVADIIACAPDEIDVADESGLRLIEPTNEVSDGVDVSGSLRYGMGMIIGGDIASPMILVNHDCVV